MEFVVCSGFLVFQNVFFFFFFCFILLWGSCLPTFLLLEDPKFIFFAGVQSIKYCNLHIFSGHQYYYRKQASDVPSFSYQALKYNNIWLQLRNHLKMRTINYGPFRTMVNVFSYKALKRGILEIWWGISIPSIKCWSMPLMFLNLLNVLKLGIKLKMNIFFAKKVTRVNGFKPFLFDDLLARKIISGFGETLLT